MDKIQELEQSYKQILINAVYGCAINSQNQKTKRCNQCLYNLGYDTDHEVICLQELERDID